MIIGIEPYSSRVVAHTTWSPLARQNVTAFASLWRARARRQPFVPFSSRKA